MVRAPAQLSGTMTVSPRYEVMNVGITDTIMLLGHDDHLTLNDPQPVGSMHEAVVAMGSNTESPLLRSVLEAYYAGNRDIWMMAVAPLSEYESDLEDRDTAYYETYLSRLQTAYTLLLEMGIEDIIVPVDAPLNSTVDFLEPLASYCAQRYKNEGKICLGFMGTRGEILQEDVDALTSDTRLSNIGTVGKFLSIFVGDGTFNLSELPFAYSQSAATTAAATFSTLPPDRGLTYRRMPNIVGLSSPELTKPQVESLALSGLNPIITSAQGRRGQPFEVVAATDNTLAPQDSDYWSLTQLRLIKTIVSEIYRLGIRRMNAPTVDQFRHEVDQYLLDLQSNGMLRGFQFEARRNAFDPYKIDVDLVLTPYFGVRSVHVDVLVAPGEGEF